jgi:hypothetical protein
MDVDLYCVNIIKSFTKVLIPTDDAFGPSTKISITLCGTVLETQEASD